MRCVFARRPRLFYPPPRLPSSFGFFVPPRSARMPWFCVCCALPLRDTSPCLFRLFVRSAVLDARFSSAYILSVSLRSYAQQPVLYIGIVERLGATDQACGWFCNSPDSNFRCPVAVELPLLIPTAMPLLAPLERTCDVGASCRKHGDVPEARSVWRPG